MATKQFNARIGMKRDTASNWEQNNPVLLNGEIIIVDTASGEVRFKVGDGTKLYTQLPFSDEAVRALISEKSGVVRYDVAQSLTAEQKQQARNNIDAEQLYHGLTPSSWDTGLPLYGIKTIYIEEGAVNLPSEEITDTDLLRSVRALYIYYTSMTLTGAKSSAIQMARLVKAGIITPPYKDRKSPYNDIVWRQVRFVDADKTKIYYQFSSEDQNVGIAVNINSLEITTVDTYRFKIQTNGDDKTIPQSYVMAANPTEDMQIATKKYVDDTITNENAVHFTEQALTDEQKQQARDNIEAGAKPIIITLTQTGPSSYTADKSYTEIANAINEGKLVCVKDPNNKLYFNYYDFNWDKTFYFYYASSLPADNNYGSIQINGYFIDDNKKVNFDYQNILTTFSIAATCNANDEGTIPNKLAVRNYVSDNTLEKTNTTEFTPTADYQPATKKYVDDATAEKGAWYVTVTETTSDRGMATADKTAEEIFAAYQAGYAVYARVNFVGQNVQSVLPLEVAEGSEDDGIILGFATTGLVGADGDAITAGVLCNSLLQVWQVWKEQLAKTADIPTVPTKTSELTNDSNFPTFTEIGDIDNIVTVQSADEVSY